MGLRTLALRTRRLGHEQQPTSDAGQRLPTAAHDGLFSRAQAIGLAPAVTPSPFCTCVRTRKHGEGLS